MIENWTNDQVTQWLLNIGLGQFSSVLNANTPFSGDDLLKVTAEVLMKKYKIAKRPAKKIIRERNRALVFLRLKPKKYEENDEPGTPYEFAHLIHVEYVEGYGFKGLPNDWKQILVEKEFVPLKADSLTNNTKENIIDNREDINNWDTEEVIKWLISVELPIFKSEFKAAGMDGSALLSLPYSELLKKLNIEPDGLAQALMKQIDVLRSSYKQNNPTQENKENSDVQPSYGAT